MSYIVIAQQNLDGSATPLAAFNRDALAAMAKEAARQGSADEVPQAIEVAEHYRDLLALTLPELPHEPVLELLELESVEDVIPEDVLAQARELGVRRLP